MNASHDPASPRLVHGISREDFEADPSRVLGLSHGYADPTPATLSPDDYYCRFCRYTMTVAESYPHFEQTGHRSVSNEMLTDPAWNEYENEKLAPIVQEERDRRIKEDREVEQMAEMLGIVRNERPKLRLYDGSLVDAPTNHGAYAEERAELARVRRENPDMPLAEAQRLALRLVMDRARLRAAGVTELDEPMDEDERREALDREYLGGSIEEIMGSSHRSHAGGGGGNKTVLFKGADGQWHQKQLMGAKSCGGGGKSGGKMKRKKKPTLMEGV